MSHHGEAHLRGVLPTKHQKQGGLSVSGMEATFPDHSVNYADFLSAVRGILFPASLLSWCPVDV